MNSNDPPWASLPKTNKRGATAVATLTQAWGGIRPFLDSRTFTEIKTLVGVAGFDLGSISHLEQKQGGSSATKGQLTNAIDSALGKMKESEQQSFITILAEELLKKDPSIQAQLEENLSRHGWGVIDKRLVFLELFDPIDLAQLPDAPRADLVKAAQRFRDGDLSGAISAACGAVDTITSSIYAECSLGDSTKASFQERCNKALEARNVLPTIEDQLRDLDWEDATLRQFVQNFKGALNQGSYVMQTLRSKMGDVHGTKPILKPLVFDALKWAELLVRTLSTDYIEPKRSKPF
jgi:hypothetical protein